MEANAGESFQMQILSNIFPRISLHCKLVPVQYREYEYGLFLRRIAEEMLKLHVSSLARQFRPHRLRYDTFISRFLRSQLQKQARPWV